tara:strand:- start:2 stop:1057 length:1056 start_codon:yes stop_codon:yes gene_type:complete
VLEASAVSAFLALPVLCKQPKIRHANLCSLLSRLISDVEDFEVQELLSFFVGTFHKDPSATKASFGLQQDDRNWFRKFFDQDPDMAKKFTRTLEPQSEQIRTTISGMLVFLTGYQIVEVIIEEVGKYAYETILGVVVARGDSEWIERIIEKQGDVNAITTVPSCGITDKMTPLEIAVANNNTTVVQDLLAKNACIVKLTSTTCYDAFLRAQTHEMLELLLSAPTAKANVATAMFYYAKNGQGGKMQAYNRDAFKILDKNARFDLMVTALKHNQMSVLCVLLDLVDKEDCIKHDEQGRATNTILMEALFLLREAEIEKGVDQILNKRKDLVNCVVGSSVQSKITSFRSLATL